MDHWGGDEGKCVLHLHEQVDRHQVVRPSRDDHVGPLFRLHVEPTPPQQRAHISCNLDEAKRGEGGVRTGETYSSKEGFTNFSYCLSTPMTSRPL
jgi:hypothetical protein